MSQQYRQQRKSSQSTTALPALLAPHLPPSANANSNNTSALSLNNVTPGSLLNVCDSENAHVPVTPTSLESTSAAKTQNLDLLLNLIPAEYSNDTAEPDTERIGLGGDDCEGEGEEEGEGQICTNSDSGSLESVASSCVGSLPAYLDHLTARYSASGRPNQKPNRHLGRQRWPQERQSQANISVDSADRASRIADWIPPPPELPLSPKLLDLEIAATYPLPPSRACSEPTPSTQQPPYQLPPYPAVPCSTASSSSMHAARPGGIPRLEVSPSLEGSGTTDVTWGPDSPPTAALRLKRAAAISALPPPPPTHVASSQDSDSTGVTDVEAELGVLEEAGRKEVIWQRILLWSLIAERDNDGEI